MTRARKLQLPTTLTFVALAATTAISPWACGGGSSGGGGATSTASGTAGQMSGTAGSSEHDFVICVPGPDAGTDQKCPNSPPDGGDCPPGCEGEVV